MAARPNTREERLRKQRQYQEQYRKRMKASREPDRDEIARELLHYAITENLKNGRASELRVLANAVLMRLAARGFDREAAEHAFVAIVNRYEAGWTFQSKLHLLPQLHDATEPSGESDGH